MSVFHYDKDSDGIVTITMDMTGPVNSMNAEYRAAMHDAVAQLEAEEGLSGVVITSAKKTFFAGGNLHELLAFKKGEEAELLKMSGEMKNDLRRLEKLHVPVVAAINGAALGVKEGVVAATLEPGENLMILGGVESPHRFFIHVEEVADS